VSTENGNRHRWPGSLPGTQATGISRSSWTPSQDLGDDLVKSAVLVDGEGRQYKPTAWEGAAPGGHHREGVLRFNPVSPPPQAIELQIRRPGEARTRVFRWELR
jgi:hypothetical protein